MGFVGYVVDFARRALRLGRREIMTMIDKP
jgi:hypothetical protein